MLPAQASPGYTALVVLQLLTTGHTCRVLSENTLFILFYQKDLTSFQCFFFTVNVELSSNVSPSCRRCLTVNLEFHVAVNAVVYLIGL